MKTGKGSVWQFGYNSPLGVVRLGAERLRRITQGNSRDSLSTSVAY